MFIELCLTFSGAQTRFITQGCLLKKGAGGRGNTSEQTGQKKDAQHVDVKRHVLFGGVWNIPLGVCRMSDDFGLSFAIT